MTFRSRKLLDVSHEAPCMLRVPVVCQDGLYPSVPCHSNQQKHGRGVGHKSHDCFAVPGCTACHDWLDRGPAGREEKQHVFDVGKDRYWLWLWENDKVKVA